MVECTDERRNFDMYAAGLQSGLIPHDTPLEIEEFTDTRIKCGLRKLGQSKIQIRTKGSELGHHRVLGECKMPKKQVYKYRKYDISIDDYVYSTRYATVTKINRIEAEPVYGTGIHFRRQILDGRMDRKEL
jgi:hypothetical protein